MFQVNSSYSVSSKPTEQILDHYIHSKEKHENCLNNILNENNQTKKNIPEGELQMLKALSYALFFSTSHAASIQKICNQQLLSMIKYDNLNEKLQFFKKNKIIYRDFCNNPCENIAFERAFFELASLVFKVRIVIYTATEDLYFTSLIINNRFEKTIQFLRSNTHFDVLYDTAKTEAIKISQEIIFGEINKRFGVYHLKFEDWLSLNPEHELADLLLNMHNDIRTKSRHKKSLSDNFNISHEQMESNHKKYYEMFANLKEPQEFFSKITASSKSRFVSNFNNENLYEEKKTGNDNKKMPFEKNTLSDYFSNSLAIKNYNISASNISSLNTSFTKQNYEEPNNKNSIYYNSKSLFSNETDNKNQKFPGNYLGTTPPGLTPQKSNKELSQKFHDDKFLKDENLEKNEIEKNIKAEINLSFENNQNYFNSLNDNRNYPAYMDENGNDSKKYFQNKSNKTEEFTDQKKIIIIDENGPKIRKTGRLKFFDENKNYGFIVTDEDGSDLFVHYDDLVKAGMTKEFMRTAKHGNIIRFSYLCMVYIGKYNKSKKAVELEVI